MNRILGELADRCEQATGEDATALLRLEMDICGALGLEMKSHERPFMASLDAAITLVPEGRRRVEFGTYDGGNAWAYVLTKDGIVGESDDAPTEAAALTAASLRTHAAKEGGE